MQNKLVRGLPRTDELSTRVLWDRKLGETPTLALVQGSRLVLIYVQTAGLYRYTYRSTLGVN